MSTAAGLPSAPAATAATSATHLAALLATPYLHVDGVKDARGFVKNHYGEAVPVPPAVHYAAYRQLMIRLRGGPGVDAAEGFFRLKDLARGEMLRLLQSRFLLQPSVDADNIVHHNINLEEALKTHSIPAPRQAEGGVVDPTRMMVIGLFTDGFINNSDANVGIRAGMVIHMRRAAVAATDPPPPDAPDAAAAANRSALAAFEREGAEADARSAPPPGLTVSTTKDERVAAFMFERCVRVLHRRREVAGLTDKIVEYSAVLGARSGYNATTMRMSDPVWREEADFYQTFPFIDINVINQQFVDLRAPGTSDTDPLLLVPQGHPVGDMIIRALHALDRAQAAAGQPHPSAFANVGQYNVAGTDFITVKRSMVESVRAAMRKSFADFQQREELMDIGNLTITAESADGDAIRPFDVMINLGILYAPLGVPAGHTPLTNRWLPAAMVDELMNRAAPYAARFVAPPPV